MKIAVAVVLSALCCSIHAQQTFTEHLTRRNAGEGTVVLHQDAELTALVNGKTRAPGQATTPTADANTTAAASAGTATETAAGTNGAATHRLRTNGYRIQVYAGGNDRRSKAEAYHMANLVRSDFPEVAVYTHFISPRWICRVGDFKSYEEATDMLRRMRQTQKFREASIVKSKIVISY